MGTESSEHGRGAWRPWRTAMDQALYGPDGFYRRPGAGPAGHFRTSAHNPLFAEAVRRLLGRVDAALGRPARLDLVDMGAGRAELTAAVRALVAADDPDLAARLRTVAVEVGPRPADLAPGIEWAAEPPERITGLLIANEWLDNVVLDVAEVCPDGTVRILEVDPATGAERPGPEPSAEQAAWLARWWPLAGAEPGTRAEIGLDRDAAWAGAVGRVERGLAVAIDYAHSAGDRPEHGTLTGFRAGQQITAVPDGSGDVTAHVALDACAAAVDGAGVGAATSAGAPADAAALHGSRILTQRAALRALGVTGARPPLSLATTDPLAYVRALSAASGAAELTDPAGLGAFGWLLTRVGLADDGLDQG